jgi:hypothetical protein
VIDATINVGVRQGCPILSQLITFILKVLSDTTGKIAILGLKLGKGSQNFHDTIVFLEHLRE